jgi:hypothetical protein
MLTKGSKNWESRIIIKTSDADVIVLCIYFDKQMTNTSELWVQMGKLVVLRTVVGFTYS